MWYIEMSGGMLVEKREFVVWGRDLRNGEMLWHVACIESKRGQSISSLLGG